MEIDRLLSQLQRMTMFRRILISTFLTSYLFLLCASVGATVGATDLKTLTQDSVAIVVAKVEDVRLVGEANVAFATVLSTFKNMQVGQKFAFVAERTWTCDTSEAFKGETILLFLENATPLPTKLEDSLIGKIYPIFEAEKAEHFKDSPLYFIANSGRGRIPIEDYKKASYLRVGKGRDPEINKPCLYFYGIYLPPGLRSSVLPIVPYEYLTEYEKLPKKPVFRCSYVRFEDVARQITRYTAEVGTNQ
jgi:hypothetical protein